MLQQIAKMLALTMTYRQEYIHVNIMPNAQLKICSPITHLVHAQCILETQRFGWTSYLLPKHDLKNNSAIHGKLSENHTKLNIPNLSTKIPCMKYNALSFFSHTEITNIDTNGWNVLPRYTLVPSILEYSLSPMLPAIPNKYITVLNKTKSHYIDIKFKLSQQKTGFAAFQYSYLPTAQHQPNNINFAELTDERWTVTRIWKQFNDLADCRCYHQTSDSKPCTLPSQHWNLSPLVEADSGEKFFQCLERQQTWASCGWTA
jgi:hypothetical protein